MSPPRGVLFVCYANVCRSPLAEGVFRHLVDEAGLGARYKIDSAGTAAMAGAAPHPFSVEAAAAHGLRLEGQSRQLLRGDLDAFDEILVMDRANLRQIRRLLAAGSFRELPPTRARLRLLASLGPGARDDAEIDDPVGKAREVYDALFDQIHAACSALLEQTRDD